MNRSRITIQFFDNINIFSDCCVHWIVPDKRPASLGIASVSIKNVEFKHTVFTFYGIVSFDNCIFRWWFFMLLYRNQCEPELSPETLTSFDSNTAHNRIAISRGQVRDCMVHIYIIEVVREILKIHIRNESSIKFESLTLACVVVKNSTVAKGDYELSAITISAYGPTSLGICQFRNTDFYGSSLYNAHRRGLVGFHLENCTFRCINEGGIHVQDAIQINITKCQFRLKDDTQCKLWKGCSVNVKGCIYLHTNSVQLARTLFFPTCTSCTSTCTYQWQFWVIVHIKNSVFVGSTGTTGGAISCEAIGLIITNCVFTMAEKNRPAPPGGFYTILVCSMRS